MGTEIRYILLGVLVGPTSDEDFNVFPCRDNRALLSTVCTEAKFGRCHRCLEELWIGVLPIEDE